MIFGKKRSKNSAKQQLQNDVVEQPTEQNQPQKSPLCRQAKAAGKDEHMKNQPEMTLRIPEDLLRKLLYVSNAEGRSPNNHIIMLLLC